MSTFDSRDILTDFSVTHGYTLDRRPTSWSKLQTSGNTGGILPINQDGNENFLVLLL